MPDGSVVALVSKQVTAYNAVNNSTVSRTSASKYGEISDIQGSFVMAAAQLEGSWLPGAGAGGESGRLATGSRGVGQRRLVAVSN